MYIFRKSNQDLKMSFKNAILERIIALRLDAFVTTSWFCRQFLVYYQKLTEVR
jgi:cell division protein FtsB